jgi:glucose-1-phosphate adenylyltransferase
MPSLENILGVILGGGVGARLYPLTRLRSKPAVPIAGKYRLIDIPISNCINSDIYNIAVLTQYNSVSLHRHIANTYQFDPFHSGNVQIWAAEQTPSTTDWWYQGTADAVRKQLFEIRSTRAKYVLILAGDHLYRMNYAAMAEFHWQHNADITVAVQPVPRDEASRLGILKVGENERIVDFAEKPKDLTILDGLVSRPHDQEKPFLGSMGIYFFNVELLFELLENSSFDDFGHYLPTAITKYGVYGYSFDGYWVDIGTMRSFYETNLELAIPDPPFKFYEPDAPIYTRPRFLPGSIIHDCILENVLLAEGCTLLDAEIRRSVIGLRSQIGKGVKIFDSVLMGCDYYDSQFTSGLPLGIGAGCQISGAIIDKNARLGANVIIKPFPRGVDYDHGDWVVRDGIVVISKNVTISSGTVISPESVQG